MKRMICLLLLTLLTGCSAPEADVAENDASEPEAVADVPALDELYQDAPLPEEYVGSAVQRTSIVADLAYMPSLEEGLQRADTIVRASAVGYHHIPPESYDAVPWTSVTLLVSECLRGDVEAGETVQMYAMEGWSLGTDGVAVYSTLRFGGLPVQGKEYVLCMSKHADGELPDGAFERLCGRHGMLQILDDGETLAYAPYEEPETVRTMTMDEFYGLLGQDTPVNTPVNIGND